MRFLDLIFPNNYKCMFCGRESDSLGICARCMEEIPWITGKVCIKCGDKMVGEGDVCLDCKEYFSYFTRVYSIAKFEGEFKSKILAIKEEHKKYFAKRFSEIVRWKYREIGGNFDIIIPVPITQDRRRDRGYNQAELLVEGIRQDGGNVDTSVLIRTRDIPHQSGLGRRNRENNSKGLFKVVSNVVKGKVILLIDDIYTTGATMSECSRVLLKAGAKEVYGLCLARA